MVGRVASKLGKVACDSVRGTLDFQTEGEKEPTSWKCTLQAQLHPKSPFGAVASHWRMVIIDESRQITQEWDVKLRDFGENTESAIPNEK